MNIETHSRVSSKSGKHGSIRVAMSEPQSSNDATLDEMLPTDYTYDFTDPSIQYEAVCGTGHVRMKISAQCAKVHSLKYIFFGNLILF